MNETWIVLQWQAYYAAIVIISYMYIDHQVGSTT